MAYPFDDEPKKDNLALADISMFKSEPLSQPEAEPPKPALADLNMVSKEAPPVEKKPTAFDLGVTFNPAAATAPVPKEFETRMDLARIKEFRQDQQSQEAPDRGPLGELAASLGRGAANILVESPLVLGQWGAKALGAEETAKSLDPYIESVKAIQETQALRPGKKAEAGPEVELDKTFSDPRAVLGQIKENVSNPYFWLSKVPEAGMSWLPIIGATKWVRWVGQAEKLVAGMEAAQAVGATAKAAEFASKLARVSKLAETAGYATGMAMEAADQAGRLRDWEQKTGKRVDWATQVGTVLGAGALAGALEKVGLDKVTKLFEGKRGAATVMKILDTVAWEGATEGAQEVIQNAAEKYGYNLDKKLTEGVVEAVLIGAALGGAGGTMAKAKSTWNQLLSGAKSEQGDVTAAPVTTTHTDNLQPTAEAGADITAPATQATPVEKTSGENAPLSSTSEGLDNFINAPVPEQPGGPPPPVETGTAPSPPPAPAQDLDPDKFAREWLTKQPGGPASMTSLILEYAEAKGLANLDASHEILPILEAMEKTGELNLKDVAREDGEWGDTMLTFTPLGSVATTEKGEAAEAPKREPVSVGKTAEVVTSQGTKADTQYQVYDIKDLIASHDSGLLVNPDYLKELQPRDRKRAETELLVGRIASAPDPEQLAENRMASDGAPIVGSDMMVEAGNGRVIGMKRAYERGTAQAYKQWLVDNADRFGLDPKAIAAVEQPLMVRMRTTEVDRPKFARESNMASVTAMSPAERAKSDAQALMDNKLLDFFHTDDDNRIDTKDNKSFVRAFLGRVVGKAELNSLLDSRGDISKAGLDRIRAAVLSAAYGETGVIEKLLEDTNDQTKNISHALMKTAPHVAKIRYQIQKGELHDRSMDNELAEAMRILQKTREAKGNLADSIRHIEFMDEVDPLVKELLNVFQAHGRARNRIAAVITNYYNIVGALGNPKQGEIFGPAEIIGKPEILVKAIEMMEAEYAQETEQVPGEVPEAESRGDEAAGQDIGRKPEEKAGAEQGESGTLRERRAEYQALKPSSATPTPTSENLIAEPTKPLGSKPVPLRKSNTIKDYLEATDEAGVAFESEKAEVRAIEKAAREVEAANQGGKSNVQESIEAWRSEVAKVYHQQKYVNLTGYQIKGPEDLADLMQIYRTPKKEILHVVYADADRNILAHNAMTSGALSFVSVGDMTKFMHRVQKTANKLGAAKVHVMHNHPSGDPSMSLYDKKFANTLKNGSQLRTKITGLGDLMGDFLVIDHGTFTHFNYETGKEAQGSYQVRRADGSKADNWMDERMTADAKTLAMMTQHLNLSADQVALVYLDLNNNINGWSVHRANIMEKSQDSLFNVLSQQAKAHDTSRVGILFGSRSDFARFDGRSLRERWALGDWVYDAISPDRESLRQRNPIIFGPSVKTKKPVKTAAAVFAPEPKAEFGSNRDDIDAYKDDKVADTRSPKTTGAKRAKEWIVKQFNAFYEKWIDAFVAIEDLSDWVELQAKQDQNTRIPGRHVALPTGQIPKYSLDAVRGKAAGWVDQAIKGEGVFWDDMVEGVETLKVQELALQARQEFIDKGKVSADTKEKLDKELARKFFSGGPPVKVGDSLVKTLEPLNELAKRREFGRDQVYSDLFDALMVAERDIELAARGNIKGVDEARSRQVIDALKAEYGADYKVLEDTAGAVRDWIDMAILQPLVRVGRLSQQTYDLIKASNQFYVPYFRLIEEMSEREHVPSTVNIMEVRNIPVKEIKGSEKQILPPLDMILYLTYNVANIYARAKTAKTLMDLPLFMDETGITIEAPKFHPQEVQLRQAVDKQLREGLTKVANSLGVTVDYTTRHRKLGRRTLGAYLKATGASQNTTDQIMMLFGSTEKTLSHELGHVVDDKFDLQSLLLKDPVTRKEVRLVADQRAGATPNKAYHKYVRSRPEQVAEFVCRYLTAKDLCRAVAPQATAKLEKLFGLVPELQPLLTMMPGFETGTMTIEDQVWVRSPFPPKENCMLVYDNGLPKWVKLPPDVYRACMAMTPAEVDAVVKLLAAPANWLRAGAVLNPEFSARNIPRDLMVAKLFSKHGFKVDQWLVDAYNLATGDEATRKLYHQFAAGSGVFADQPHSMQDVAKITADDIKGVKKPYIVYANPIKAYQIILHYLRETSGASENVTRFSLYRQAIDRGASHVEAIHEARRTTLDFNRHGAAQAARMMGMIIPFFNPSLQGVDKVFHELVSPKNPRRGAAWFRVMTHITLPSIVLWLLFHRDKRIQELEDYEKNYFWHIPLGSDGPILRIPKPFEVGILFGSMPQKIFDAAVDKDADGIKTALGAALDALTPSPMPTLMRLFVESRSNYNFFTERRIEDQAQQQLPPELRGKPWTMELSKAFSKHIGKHLDISPAMFEHWVRTLGGGLWANYMLPTADLTLRKIGVLEDIPKPKGDLLNEIPGIRAFFSRMPTGHRSKSVNDFFERYGAVIQADQGWKKLWKDGDIKAANEFLKDHPEAIFAKVAHRTMKEMGDIRSERTKIYQSNTLSPESKRKALDRLDDRMMTLARSAGTYMNPDIAKSVTLPATRTIDGAMDIKQYYERISIPTFEKYQEMKGKLPKLADMSDTDKRDKMLLGEIKQEMKDFLPLQKKPESTRPTRPDSIYDKPTRKERAEWQQTYGPGARVKKGLATGFRLKPEKETE